MLIFLTPSGYNHSGKQGSVEFLNGMMGMVNAERTLNIIKSLIEFIMLDDVRDVSPFIPQILRVRVELLYNF